MAYIEGLLSSILAVLTNIAPTLSIILIVASGMIYGLSHIQPAETRGKWQSLAVGFFLGGVIIAAFVGAADIIRDASTNLLK